MCSYRPRANFLGKGIFFAFMAIAFLLLIGFVVMWLWNWLIPEITSFKPINYWQAVGLLLLSRILFGGFRFGGSGHRKDWKNRRKGYWKSKWANMDEDKKEKLKRGWDKYLSLIHI